MNLDELRSKYVQVLEDEDMRDKQKDEGATDEGATDEGPEMKNMRDKQEDKGFDNQVIIMDMQISAELLVPEAATVSYGSNLVEGTWSMSTSQRANVTIDQFNSPADAVKLIRALKSEWATAGGTLDEEQKDKKELAKFGAKLRANYRIQLFQRGKSLPTASSEEMSIDYNETYPNGNAATGTTTVKVDIRATAVPFTFMQRQVGLFKAGKQALVDMGYRVNSSLAAKMDEFTEHTASGPDIDIAQAIRVLKPINAPGVEAAMSQAAKQGKESYQSTQQAMEEAIAKMDDPSLLKTADAQSGMLAALEQEEQRKDSVRDASIEQAQRQQEVERRNNDIDNQNAQAAQDAANQNTRARVEADNTNAQIAAQNAQRRQDNLTELVDSTQQSWKENANRARETTKAEQEFQYGQDEEFLQGEVKRLQQEIQQAQLYQGTGVEEISQGFNQIKNALTSVLNSATVDGKNNIPVKQFPNAVAQALKAATNYQQYKQYYDNLAQGLITAIGGIVAVPKNPTNLKNMQDGAASFFVREEAKLKQQRETFKQKNVDLDMLQRELAVKQQQLAEIDGRYVDSAKRTDMKSFGNLPGRQAQGAERFVNSDRARKNTYGDISDFVSKTFGNFRQGGKVSRYQEWLRQHTH